MAHRSLLPRQITKSMLNILHIYTNKNMFKSFQNYNYLKHVTCAQPHKMYVAQILSTEKRVGQW